VLVAPLMPGINDAPEQVEAVVEACREAGATRVGGQALFLRGATKDVFMGYLRDRRPDLVPMYEQLYGRRTWLQDADKKRVEAPLRRLARAYAPPPTGADRRFRGFGLAGRWERDRSGGVEPAGEASPAGRAAPDRAEPDADGCTPDLFAAGRGDATAAEAATRRADLTAAEVATGRLARGPADGRRAGAPRHPAEADATDARVEEARLALGRQEALF
jgi:hypothetical protein